MSPTQSMTHNEAQVTHPVNHGKTARRRWLVLLAALAVAGVLLVSGIRSRIRAKSDLVSLANQMAVPSVSVVNPKRAAPTQELILPGNTQPFISSPVYARTDGYLRKWYFDIGAHVKAGQLLAVIEAPEVDQQLAQARATLATAQANLQLAQITKDRYEGLLKKHAVSQQDVDNAVGTYNANKAIVEADEANVLRYAALVSFRKSLCSLRWRDYRPQHRHRRPDQRGEQHGAQNRPLPRFPDRGTARLCERPGRILARREARSDGCRHCFSRVSWTAV